MLPRSLWKPGGVYFNHPSIDPWDKDCDARNYNGPFPVIAHPPCERWGKFWSGGPTLAKTIFAKRLGDDDGCFASALTTVRRFGGVIEHPSGSQAWKHFGLIPPSPKGGWWPTGDDGWGCCVAQGYYGHCAEKMTWLYTQKIPFRDLPELIWGKCLYAVKWDLSAKSYEERRRLVRTGICQSFSKKQRTITPLPFRDLLISLASSVVA